MNDDRFKFRVWDNNEKRYWQCFVIEAESGEIFTTNRPDGAMLELEDGYTIEQCTGLRDRNGKLIYEGDILENTPAGWTFRVMWNGAAWFAESDEPPLLERLNIIPLGICKVVGNIHEVKDE